MTSPIADGVMAATYKLVQQAMTGQWQDVPKTLEERRALLDQLSASASPQDQQWLGALRQAMAESDAAVAKMSQVEAVGNRETRIANSEAGVGNRELDANDVDHMLGMLRSSK